MTRLKTARQVVDLVAGRRDWYRIEDHDTRGSADVYLYDEIGYFGVTAADFVRDLGAIKKDAITLHINSPGGEVFDGLAIYNAIRDHKAHVTTTVDGLAASAASFIAMAGDEVVMNRNSQMMIHDAAGLAIGNSADMRSLADLLDKTSENIASIYAERTGTLVDQWRTAMQAETWYSADEAVKAGLADRVASTEGSKTENNWDLSIFKYSNRSQAPAPAMPGDEFDAAQFRAALQGEWE